MLLVVAVVLLAEHRGLDVVQMNTAERARLSGACGTTAEEAEARAQGSVAVVAVVAVVAEVETHTGSVGKLAVAAQPEEAMQDSGRKWTGPTLQALAVLSLSHRLGLLPRTTSGGCLQLRVLLVS